MSRDVYSGKRRGGGVGEQEDDGRRRQKLRKRGLVEDEGEKFGNEKVIQGRVSVQEERWWV